jgi:hypothetical protein
MSETSDTYVIKIISATKPKIWYEYKKGEIFEATIEKREGLQMYKVASFLCLYVYPQDVEIVSIKKVPKYTR